MKTTEKILYWLFLSLGAILFGLAVFHTVYSNFTAGTVMCYLLGVVLLCFGIFYEKFYKKLPKWLRACFLFGLLFITVFVTCVYICGMSDNVQYDEDAVIVLGAGIKGERIGKSLKSRLDVVVEYHKRNKDAIIVVSGGQGPYEDITEALAMERYLVENGVDPSVIIKEERSTSTEENFKFSKELLDSRFENGYKTAYITNSFHIYRAGETAESVGFSDMTHIHAETPLTTLVPNGLREMLAILKMWIFGA